mmetsp:Transcript_464/g.1126  ORF Transcript_464/g.1126 Transcript_464/m.1126 type:complete len:280 (-) Transcript_464:149-988(-)
MLGKGLEKDKLPKNGEHCSKKWKVFVLQRVLLAMMLVIFVGFVHVTKIRGIRSFQYGKRVEETMLLDEDLEDLEDDEAVLATPDILTNLMPNVSSSCEGFSFVNHGRCLTSKHDAEDFAGSTYEIFPNVTSRTICEDLCEEYPGCTGFAYDYREAMQTCELFTREVQSVDQEQGIWCFKRSQEAFGLLGEGYCHKSGDGTRNTASANDYVTYCNVDFPCAQEECESFCSQNGWCRFYEFTQTRTDFEDVQVGRCNLFQNDIDSARPSKRASCYAKICIR